MNITHTPGPWEMGFDPYGYRITAKAPTANLARREICKVAAYIDPNSDEEANARLIASAPELLESLSECAMLLMGIHLGQVQSGDMSIRCATDSALELIAIAKAEGKAAE